MSSETNVGVSAQHGPRRIVFAGGGTAGHVEPALAVARNWVERYPMDKCIFVGTESGLENTLVPHAGFELQRIAKVTLPRSLDMRCLAMPIRLVQSVLDARKILRGADLLIGFGGYVSASTYLAAKISRVPFVVHEANAKPGWANLLGAVLSKHIAITHPISKGRFKSALPTGLPLRSDVHLAAVQANLDWKKARLAAKKQLDLTLEKPTILVLGGSQGSIYLNTQIERALATLIGQGFQVIHSVGGKNKLPASSSNYRALSYIENMATAYLAADVLIARSGAVTCAEFATLGRSAIFIPLPTGNGEQARNADFLVASGRAIVIAQDEFDSQWLIRNIASALERAGGLEKSGLLENLTAATKITDLMEHVLKVSK